VSVSAGNSPNSNAMIGVYIPPRQGVACFPGDFLNCYPGNSSEIGVGTCESGIRTCQPNGTFTACTGAVTPLTEYPDLCDGLDNDCDGRIDNGCDVLTENPTVFTQGGTFSLPPGAVNVDIAVWAPGRAGASATSGWSGSGGGSGGLSVLESLAVDSGDQFVVNMNAGRSAVVRNGLEIAVATAGVSSSGGAGSTTNGNDGEPGIACVLETQQSSTCGALGGHGGIPLQYLGRTAGAGGNGASLNRGRYCYEYCEGYNVFGMCLGYVTSCSDSSSQGTPTPGGPGLVVVSWH
jgi:hypothetical protein